MLAHGCAQPVSCSWTGGTGLCAGFQGSSPEQEAQREKLGEGGRNWLGLRSDCCHDCRLGSASSGFFWLLSPNSCGLVAGAYTSLSWRRPSSLKHSRAGRCGC